MAQTAKEARASIAIRRRAGVLATARGFRLREVPRSSTANMVHGAVLDLPLSGRLTLELFVEAEDCFLGRGVDVSCAAAAAGEFGCGVREAGFEERGWAPGVRTGGCLGCFEGVPCAAATSMNKLVGGGVGFGDGVLGWHFVSSCVVLWRDGCYLDVKVLI